MQSFIKMLLPFAGLFGGPITGLMEKGFTLGIVYLLTKGSVDPASASGIAAEFWLAISATISAVNKTQTAKIASINGADNGVKVVTADTAASAVSEPRK